jgi:hypothetical protein
MKIFGAKEDLTISPYVMEFLLRILKKKVWRIKIYDTALFFSNINLKFLFLKNIWIKNEWVDIRILINLNAKMIHLLEITLNLP